ncbi:MAG: rhodanese-like domain-containing protein [Tannerella sp.]|jgi:rhodanese-related sulfurtransferase|nr:rhodanese-like domain-containing protein [Tannerella sp.]
MKRAFILHLLLSACVHSSQENPDAFIKSVSEKPFKKLVEAGDGIILDVRTSVEIADGHIANAQIADVNDATFVEKINLLPKEKAVYVYCRSGKRSLKAADILQKNGFKRIYNLKSGILGWIEKGYPIVRDN